MGTQHTPGPWSLNTQYADIEVRGPAESGVLIAVMSPWGIAAEGPSPQAANARLIAAAPELLEALLVARKNIEDWRREHGCCAGMELGALETIDAAIAKAAA